MEEIIKLSSVDKYCEFFGMETQNPLVAVIDLKDCTRHPTNFSFNYGLYALFLKENLACNITYGRQKYDYQEGTVTSFAPGIRFAFLISMCHPIAMGIRRYILGRKDTPFSNII